jgi:hypothetical protein
MAGRGDPQTYRDLLQRLKQPPYNVSEHKAHKDSKRMWKKLGPDGKGPSYPVSMKGSSTEIPWPTIKRILERFDIDEYEFFGLKNPNKKA